MKLVAFHLFNDYSGSPKVLRTVLSGLLKKNVEVDLFTSRGGVLDEIRNERLHHYRYSYRFSMNPVVTMLRYFYAQLRMFFFAFRYLFKKDIVFYINTILPVGAALAGKIMGKRIVYHYHENAYVKSSFYSALGWLMEHMASDIICVSEFQKSCLKRKKNVHVVPNALPSSFTDHFKYDAHEHFDSQRVLMVASLKKYKGIMQFFDLASQMPNLKFEMVVNDDQGTIDEFVKSEKITITDNLTIYPRQEDVAPFYAKSSLVLNLSDTNQVLETFGLTALEAMSAGLPVIVPEKGGVAELVEDGVNGYKIDVCRLGEIRSTIEKVLSEFSLYGRLSEAAYLKSKNYSEEKIINKIFPIIKGE